MIMVEVKPNVVREMPHIEGESIGLIAGAGRVTTSFLTMMAYKNEHIPIKVYARDEKTKAKLKTFVTDLGIGNVEITTNLGDVQSCETTIFCAGAKTKNEKGKKTKEDLLNDNKELARELLSKSAACKAIIVVTNPTTKLVPFIEEITGKPTYGMGVENDNIRFRRSSKENDIFLLGAHNFFELIVASKKGAESCSFEFNRAVYKEISEEQDRLLKEEDMGIVQKHIDDLPKEYRWYASQRLHSKMNESTNSCSQAIYNVFRLLCGNAEHPVVIEQNISVGSESNFCCGWPCNPTTREPMEVYMSDEQFKSLASYQMEYRNRKVNHELKRLDNKDKKRFG